MPPHIGYTTVANGFQFFQLADIYHRLCEGVTVTTRYQLPYSPHSARTEIAPMQTSGRRADQYCAYSAGPLPSPEN